MIGWIILALVLVFLAVILIRTAAFTPKAESRAAAEPSLLRQGRGTSRAGRAGEVPHGVATTITRWRTMRSLKS